MMPAILAIEPDRRQAARLTALARGPIHADILVVASVDQALAAIAASVPDLILTPLLLSPRDDAALTARLRELAADGSAVQTLVIPVLAASASAPSVLERGSGLLNRLRGGSTRSSAAQPDGCDPAVFAAQVNEYLERLAAERHEHAEMRAKKAASERPAVSASAPMLQELMTRVRLTVPPPRLPDAPAPLPESPADAFTTSFVEWSEEPDTQAVACVNEAPVTLAHVAQSYVTVEPPVVRDEEPIVVPEPREEIRPRVPSRIRDVSALRDASALRDVPVLREVPVPAK